MKSDNTMITLCLQQQEIIGALSHFCGKILSELLQFLSAEEAESMVNEFSQIAEKAVASPKRQCAKKGAD